MRLIDGDALRERYNIAITRARTKQDKERYAMMRKFYCEDMKTVDAIPIEWIVQQPLYETIPVQVLVEKWEEGNEADRC